MKFAASQWREELSQTYDAYFNSRYYDARYPAANPSTLEFLRRNGVMRMGRVLDVGCGNGRYAFPILEESSAQLVGCDISAGAITAFRERLSGHQAHPRVALVHGGPEATATLGAFDAILMLFGVLSHVGRRASRVDALQQLRRNAGPQTRLLLSVPNIWRRMPAQLLKSALRDEGREWGDVTYRRVIDCTQQNFRYHLYTVSSLHRELADAGWRMEAAEPESLMPERMVCASSLAASLDGWLQRLAPAGLGYGIRAVAVPL